MREIADMGAGALDDFAVGIEQRIGLARQRCDLDREIAFEPLGLPGADRGELLGDALERSQAELHLESRGEQKHQRQPAERQEQRAVEVPDFVLDLGGIAGDRNQIIAFLAEIDIALDQPQPLILRSVDIAGSHAECRRGGRNRQPRQAAVPKRTRRVDFRLGAVELGDLPIPAGQRQFEQRFAHALSELVIGNFRRGEIGDQRAQIDLQPSVKGALHRVAIERRQHDAGDEHDREVQPAAHRNSRSASEFARICRSCRPPATKKPVSAHRAA